MLRSLCCLVKQTASSSNRSREQKLVQNEKRGSISKQEEYYRMRSLSASDADVKPPKSQKKILEDIEEENKSISLPRNYPEVAAKRQSLITTAGSSESVYKTPPTSRHPSASSHPLNTMKSASRLTITSKNSSLTRESAPPRDKRSSQVLLGKIAEAEEKRQKEHKQLLNKIENFTVKLDKVMTEIKECKTPEREVCTDGVRRTSNPKPKGLGIIDESLLPQSTPVSSEVILKLSKRVSTPQWKFLGRWLKIPDHEINTISANHKEDIQEQSYQMLLKWTQSNGGGSYQELGEAVKMEFGEKLYSEYVKMVIEAEGRQALGSNSQ